MKIRGSNDGNHKNNNKRKTAVVVKISVLTNKMHNLLCQLPTVIAINMHSQGLLHKNKTKQNKYNKPYVFDRKSSYAPFQLLSTSNSLRIEKVASDYSSLNEFSLELTNDRNVFRLPP